MWDSPVLPEPNQTLLGPMPSSIPSVPLPTADSPPQIASEEAIVLSPFQVSTAGPSIADRVRKVFAPSAPESDEKRSGGAGGGSGGKLRRLEESTGSDFRSKEVQNREPAAKESSARAAAIAEFEQTKKREAAAAGVFNRKFSFEQKAKDISGQAALAYGGEAIEQKGDKVQLSAFEVNASADRGYAAGNALAGTRLNRSLSDLGSNIQVVTKQQLVDRAEVNHGFLDDSFLTTTNPTWAAPAAFGGAGKVALAEQTPREIDAIVSPQKPAAVPAQKSQAPIIVTQGETSTAKEPVSTFSLHVSDVSFRLAQAALARGETPDRRAASGRRNSTTLSTTAIPRPTTPTRFPAASSRRRIRSCSSVISCASR